MGSTGLDKLKEQNTGGNNPGVEGALDVDPDVIGGYTCATAEAAGVKFELTTLAKMGRFDQEVSIDMPAASDIPRLETIQVKPVCMGADSASSLNLNLTPSRRWRTSFASMASSRAHESPRVSWTASVPHRLLPRTDCDRYDTHGVHPRPAGVWPAAFIKSGQRGSRKRCGTRLDPATTRLT